MIKDVAKAMYNICIMKDGKPISYMSFDAMSKNQQELALTMAKAAMTAALLHIKEAMEYHGVQGAMNKMIIERLEEQCK